MEEDRAKTDLGQAVDVELRVKESIPRQPKKRFIGRRAAAERALENVDPKGTIEDSGAIQGLLASLKQTQSR